jgi:predicted phosphodiesterase
MKIHFLSDLHIEVKSLPKGFMSEVERVEADVTVLAGDIDVGLKGLALALQIKRPVIYVMGNHEYTAGLRK